jgi:hypothetical protein
MIGLPWFAHFATTLSLDELPTLRWMYYTHDVHGPVGRHTIAIGNLPGGRRLPIRSLNVFNALNSRPIVKNLHHLSAEFFHTF